MSDRVREPIQVYLTAEERAELDRRAAELGVSRSEVLRRGIQALVQPSGAGALGALAAAGHLAPPARRGGVPPRGAPVARMAELLAELDHDRGDR